MKKRLFAFVLALVMASALLPPAALAAQGIEVDENGFAVNEDGVLVRYDGPGGDIVIPDGVTAIGGGFSRNAAITSVVIPDSVTRMSGGTFRECPNLRRVQIGNGVTEIPDYTFYECPSLTEVVIPDSVTKIGVLAFSGCAALGRVEIPASVECIDEAAFADCTALREVVLLEGLTTIGRSAFIRCAALERIEIPASVTRIGNVVFMSCTSLEEVVFHDGLTEMGESAFQSCTSLERVDLPASVEKIGQEAFRLCTSLKEVNIANPDADVDSGVFYQSGLSSYTQGGVEKTLKQDGTVNEGTDPQTVEEKRQAAIDRLKNNSAYRERLENNRNALGQIDKYTYQYTIVPDEVKAKSDEICSGLTTDTEKVTAIHKWVTENIYYDYSVLSGATERYTELEGNTQYAQNVLNNKRGVCEGYSRLFQALCWAQKIPCVYVLGKAIPGGFHAWNAVLLNGEWLWVDSTWDTFNKYYGGDNWKRGDQRLDYFLCSTEFLSTDHDASKVDVDTSNEQVRINKYIELITGEVRNGDREASEWAKDELIAAMEAQMFPYGYSRPNYTRSIDRHEFCRVAVQMIEQYTGQDIADYARSKGLTYQDPFTDWHDEDVNWIYALGIIKGTSATTFSPRQYITRQEAAVILARVARLLGVSRGDGLSFADEDTFASWASEDIEYLSGLVDPTTGNRVMQGTGGGNFSPEGSYTWEQSLITFLRLFHCAQQ